jgi:YesN/AraC family two-component response regulator
MAADTPPTPPRTVLFVDDEPAVSDGLRRLMRPQAARWRVLTAGGGEEALAVLARERVDVLVTDLRMPGMDGVALLERVRAAHPGIARIVLSGSNSDPKEAAAAHLAQRRLDKPCSRDDLIRALDEARPASRDPG